MFVFLVKYVCPSLPPREIFLRPNTETGTTPTIRKTFVKFNKTHLLVFNTILTQSCAVVFFLARHLL